VISTESRGLTGPPRRSNVPRHAAKAELAMTVRIAIVESNAHRPGER
jgi:hypothetical protein